MAGIMAGIRESHANKEETNSMHDRWNLICFPGLFASRLDYYTYSIMANVHLKHNKLPTANQVLITGFQVNSTKSLIA